jgi:heme/copper-type cytochrome/quinol oxidase subunit 4
MKAFIFITFIFSIIQSVLLLITGIYNSFFRNETDWAMTFYVYFSVLTISMIVGSMVIFKKMTCTRGKGGGVP